MTALTVNGSAVAATTLAAAGKLFNTTGGTSGSVSTKVGTSTQFKQIFAKGTTTGQTGVGSIPAPTDSNFNGWMWDVTTLEGQRIAAGTWTPTFHLLASTGTTVTPTVQWFKRSSAGAYTSIGSVAGSSIALTTSSQALTFTPPSLSLMDFATGDKLVMWLWVNQTAGGATNSTISVFGATSASSAGVVSEAQAVTPGYAPIPVSLAVTMAGIGALVGPSAPSTLTLYGSNVADSTLTTACDMAAASGGVETSQTSTIVSTALTFAEILSQGGASTPVAAIPATPTGNGWVFAPGAGTFALGNWSAIINVALANFGTTSWITIRFSQDSGGSYTLIGTIQSATTPISTINTKTQVSFSATSMSAITFGASDLLYVELWWHDETANVGGDNPTVYVSSSAAAGVANDMQVTTSTFTPGIVLSAATALSSTLAGAGTLTGTLSTSSGSVALSGEADGVGTLTGAVSLTTVLSTTLAGIGTLAGTSTLTTALTSTLAGVGTLTATTTLNTTLATTLIGAGTLTGTLSISGNVALTVTLAGSSTLTGTPALSTLLTTTLAGTSTFAGVFTIQVALSLTFMGTSTLAGTLTLPTLFFFTATWLTRDMQANWLTRDGRVTWSTRDDKAGWNTRDDKTTWDTRDDLVTWKTR